MGDCSGNGCGGCHHRAADVYGSEPVTNDIYLYATQTNPNDIGLTNGPSGSGTNVAPGAGSLLLSGFAPVIALAVAISPAVGALTLTGFAPTVTVDRPVAPAVGAMTLTGFAPTLDKGILPGVGALTFDGFAPSITIDRPVVPTVGAMTFDGLAPSVAVGMAVTPDVGSLTFDAFAPDVVVAGSETTSVLGSRKIRHPSEITPWIPPTQEEMDRERRALEAQAAAALETRVSQELEDEMMAVMTAYLALLDED